MRDQYLDILFSHVFFWGFHATKQSSVVLSKIIVN